ncbi:hypothetical protein [Hymenobacter koreensis]|uniref:XRE family transcriptional regulator n=1 Tax=Hymenobacter koreensis TaxID=1084523 RepID=A0ABP8J2W2_9BACT
MADYTRDYFGLTQERLASWLGVERSVLAHAEIGRRPLPPGYWQQEARLLQARFGLVLQVQGTTSPAPPPLPLPVPASDPLEVRLDYCRHHARRLAHQLKRMRTKATVYEARLRAVPALRAWTGPVPDPAREENWLALFEQEAENALLHDCGAGPQRLLEARLAGLEREAELLTDFLNTLPGA